MSNFAIGMLIFPNMTQLDLTGPHEVFTRMSSAKVFLVSETKDLIRSEKGLIFQADYSLEEAPAFDLIFVPGGVGTNNLLQNQKVLSWLQGRAPKTKFITSVCTGSLVLAAAGLLNGFRATTHWLSLDILKLFPLIQVIEERIVRDRNRITGGGVTAGIDFALSIVAELRGEEEAKEIQLMLEYDPEPPFRSGHPRSAPKEVTLKVKRAREQAQALRSDIVTKIVSQPKTQ
ncbi:thiamine biosynthesis protein ThiJ [Leptospira perolatii]|uniref:Thiamine biosynthesis protein ThiJ n=1 Tax=Leptospira perolatii TaxID=2023191 RepID=A0A2M9ZSQ5_9LEPT|nr:DJ-1/PfpI family protein [Leptospira perolatii]PJZ68751.1 thiamine biosynthesis protein ThiJ [Leptospira perolatii]PJZ75106.1 thiamine biosynthesis protein ThiJ [Leptospira perolatii]